MYLRFTKALVFTSSLAGFKSAQLSRPPRGALLDTPKALLQVRQETLSPVRSDDAPHSVVFLTTTVFESPHSTGSSKPTSQTPSSSTSQSNSAFSPSPTPSSPISTSLEQSSTRPPITITSTVVPSTSDTPSPSDPSLTYTNPKSPLPPPSSPSSSKGKIAGIIVGAVFGFIFLGILIYTLIAWSRGINVCNCFGGCCGKDDDDDSRRQLPSRCNDTYPYADAGAETGYGYFRTARPVRDVPLPLLLPQQVAENHRAAWVQRGGGPVRAF